MATRIKMLEEVAHWASIAMNRRDDYNKDISSGESLDIRLDRRNDLWKGVLSADTKLRDALARLAERDVERARRHPDQLEIPKEAYRETGIVKPPKEGS